MGRGRSNFHEHWHERDEAHDQYEDGYEDEPYEVPVPVRRRSLPPRQARTTPTAAPSSTSSRRPPRRRKRSIWPVLLTGCALGVVVAVLAAAIVVLIFIRSYQNESNLSPLPVIPGVGTRTMTRTDVVQSTLSTISQVQVCDRVGNVTMTVDPNASKTTVATSKIVQATSQAAANQEYQRISVEVQPPTTLTKPLACAQPAATPTPATGSATTTPSPANTTLTVNVTFPTPDSVGDSVNVAITVPPAAIQSSGLDTQLDIEAPLGNVAITGISGVMDIKGGTGVTVQRSVLAPGSQLETSQGKVTFNGYLAIPSTDNQNPPARYVLQGENGIDVTLPANTNVSLDANTNAGTGVIANDFDNTSSGGNRSANYYGPLDPSSTTKPAATLVLDVGSGNVNIHKSSSA